LPTALNALDGSLPCQISFEFGTFVSKARSGGRYSNRNRADQSWLRSISFTGVFFSDGPFSSFTTDQRGLWSWCVSNESGQAWGQLPRPVRQRRASRLPVSSSRRSLRQTVVRFYKTAAGN